jgi:F-type H+-transporting ATPase subunit gamma
MANRRVLVKRRAAVRNIRKITRTMQLIATARFQAAHKRLVASTPFTDKLSQMVKDISRAAKGLDHPLMQDVDETLPVDLWIITSNRGMCGAYNGNILRTAADYLEGLKEQGRSCNIRVVGKKGVGFMRFAGHEMTQAITELDDIPKFEDVDPFSTAIMDRFLKGEISSAQVAYMKFESAGKQTAVVEQLLPMTAKIAEDPQDDSQETALEYEFSPEPKDLLDELLPMSVRVQMFRYFNDAVVSEQMARQVAMKAATDSAEEMIKLLTQQYNRARQTAITMELLDIVGGANALA